ncbi:uncharacterized protein LOC107607482 [Arachis ipaensis]|uniref:uncharacterized protein LOC107607482 n=1 Tax=Arachis ipaensis TaxID=130454 RepID=UPI000A2B60E0|nr:uncharacterized protein LOC107607482 [Arachis ipaensis]
MVLMDEKLHKIQATIRDQLISKFAVSLNEDEIDQMTKDHNFLIDFVGIITGVRKERDVASYGKLIKAVVLEVFTHGKKVQCNVFGNACDLLEYENLQKYPRSPLIVLESFKIKPIEGGVILQNVINVSRLFINPDIPKSVEFLSRLVIVSFNWDN